MHAQGGVDQAAGANATSEAPVFPGGGASSNAPVFPGGGAASSDAPAFPGQGTGAAPTFKPAPPNYPGSG